MAATVTGLTQFDDIGLGSWINASVGGATACPGAAGTGTGIDSGQCFGSGNEANAVVAGTYYMSWSGNLFTAGNGYDISAVDSGIFFHARNSGPVGYTVIEGNADSIRAYCFSGGSSTDYAYWEFDGATFRNLDWHVLMMQGTADFETGGFDYTDVTGIGLAIEVSGNGAFALQYNIDQALHFNGPVVGEDTGGAATVTMESFYNLLKPTSGTTYHSQLIKRAGPGFEIGFPFKIASDDYDDSSQAVALSFKAADGLFPTMPAGYYGQIFEGQASGSQLYENITLATLSSDFYFTIDGSASSTDLTINTMLAAGISDVIVNGAGVTITNGSIISPATCDISDGDLQLTITDCAAPIQWTADLVAGSTITTNSDIDITFAGTNLDDINLVLTGTLTISVDPTGASQTYYLGGITTSSTLKLWNKDTSNATTIEIPAGITNQKIDLWFNYDGESGGPFTVGETLTFGNGATATLRTLTDNGTTGTMYCTYIAGTTPPDNNSITGGTSGATALVNAASGASKSTLTINQTPSTYTFNSDTASTLIRYFEDGSQTVVDSVTGTTLDYDFPDADPVDVEFVKQGYVPVNRQNVIPTDGGSLDIIMDVDEAYNASHALTITSQYDYNAGTKALTINSDQEALDVRSSLSDVIRTNSAYYNTALLMVAIPGLTRVDLTNGMTITSMETWKGAGMERFDAADSTNPVEKWVAIKSVGNITGASAYYRQTSSGNATSVSLTSNVVNEAFQYWSDPNHDGSTADGYDYSSYFVIKTFLAGTRQSRADVVASSGLAALKSNLYTISLANLAHDYAGTDPGISADLTLIAGGTVGGVVFAYEWVDGGTNTGADIADQLHYNRITTPNSVIPGGTGLRWWELPDMVIYNATGVETEKGYREGATPTVVGFYVSRGGADHPDFTRFEGDNGTYYTPPVTANATGTNLPDDLGGDTRLQIVNLTALSASAWQASTAYSAGDLVLRTTGTGSESTAGLFFRCTTAGTSGGSEPSWVTTTAGIFGTPGSTTTDNTVTWQCFAILLYDSDPASTGWSDTYIDNYEFADGETARITFAHMDGSTSFELGRTTAAVTSSGFSFDASLFVEANSVFAINAIDGSARTEFTADYTDTEIDVSSDTDSSPENAFAWYCYNLTTSAGMYRFWNAVTAIDTANYRNNTAVASIKFDNTTTGSVSLQGTGARFFRDDGANPVKDPTTSGYGVALTWELPVYAYDGGGGGFTAGDRADLTSIKGKTDSLTFTVSNKVDANTQYMNDAQVQGDGSSGDKWRGV